jgi:hypothetical protein
MKTKGIYEQPASFSPSPPPGLLGRPFIIYQEVSVIDKPSMSLSSPDSKSHIWLSLKFGPMSAASSDSLNPFSILFF